MFTGIINQVIPIVSIKESTDKKIFSIRLKEINEAILLGESIAINGVCQTVSAIKGNEISFYTMQQTLADTNINNLQQSDMVNVEFSLTPASKISGHFVTGHVDCLGKIIKVEKKNDATGFHIDFPDNFSNLIVKKGSIAVNGISLTVSNVINSSFTFMAIPQTMMTTTLQYTKEADMLNLEFDILAKYLNANKGHDTKTDKDSSKITLDLLRQKGFIS
ncbi:MAG: riboflavin synthase [Candidatus Kappaea frigidicola]|nr:riboflavin synthase [Candidatus Kappaea frigidicola]